MAEGDEPAESSATGEGDKMEFDFSKIDPEKVFLCFGTIQPEHQECVGCPVRQKCADKAGVTI